MAANSQPKADLAEYRRKRLPGQTPEPFGEKALARPGLFVVQQHDATRMHFDFRLELGGTLKSWAVPRGPSLNPAEKRMAVHVEDHPVEYADFEGIIPEGNYGAGAVIVWDRGRWIALEDPMKGLEKGKLLFELRGHKLRGVWTLVRTSKGAKDWLLIKKPDGAAKKDGELPPESVLSNLTVEQLRDGQTPEKEVCAALAAAKAPRRPVRASDVELMLAEPREKPFSGKGWLFELKYDGFRLLAFKDGAQVRLQYRRGRDATAIFPEVALAVSKLPCERVALDGEVVVLDEESKPTFQRLQKRAQLSRAPDVERAMLEHPATMFAFDLLGFDDYDARPLPLEKRKALLERLVPKAGPLRYADHFEERGEELFAQVSRLGFEGIVAKQASSPYRAGRTPAWQKIAIGLRGDFAVVGFTEPDGSRSGFGALLLGYREGELWRFAGGVGSGFDEKQLAEIRAQLEHLRRPTCPCTGEVPRQKGSVWVEPKLVCEARFKAWTADGQLRQSVFVRMRDDKTADECGQPIPHGEAPEAAPAPAEAEPAERKIAFTNLDKVFWPEDGYTKGDLIAYYRSVAPWLLAYLKDRPLVLTRFPDGIHGKSFFQKDAPAFVPSWIRRVSMWSDDSQRDIHHFVCEDEDSLAYLVNLGTIPLHIWSARVSQLEQPDWCIIDLDPKQAPFSNVVKLAQIFRKLCEEIDLPCFPKTTGSSGLHLLIPLGCQCTHAQATSLGELLARVVAQEHAEIATIARAVGDRGKRVYLDYLQNGRGKLIASPFCARPLPHAPVSMPLRWNEVNAKLKPQQFTLANARKRMDNLGEDPLRPVLDLKPNLARALEQLSLQLARAKRV